MYFVYVLQNSKGVLYKGQTDNLSKRIEQHNANDGFPSYTNKRGPWKLVYSESFLTRKEAKERENFFKSGQGRVFLKAHLGNDAPLD